MTDILDGIAQVRMVFQRENLKAPTAILLESHEEGMRFLTSIRQTEQWIYVIGSPDLGHPIEMADGSVWMECKVMDIAVRWPANKFATSDGEWSYG